MDKDQKKQNMMDYTCAAVNYNSLLLRYGISDELYKVRGTLTKKSLSMMSIIYYILLISLFKEDCIEKDEHKNLKLKVCREYYDDLLEGVAIKQPDNTYRIGDIAFKDTLEVLDKIRNKLLHGDFLTDEDAIVLNDNGKTGRISLRDLVELSRKITICNMLKSTGEVKTPIIFVDLKRLPETPIQSASEFEQLIKEFYYVEIVDKPIRGERTLQYLGDLRQAVHTLEFVLNDESRPKEEILKDTIEMFKPILTMLNIDLSYRIIPIQESPNYPKLIQFFKSRQNLIFPNAATQIQYLNSAITNLIADNMDKTILTGAIYNNILVQDAINKISPVSLDDFVCQGSATFDEDMVIMSFVAAFYAMYHYGIDDILSNSSSTSLKSIAKGEYLDFSKLDLSGLEGTVCDMEIQFKDFPNQLVAMKRKVVEAEEAVKKANEILKGYTSQSIFKQKREKRKLLKEKINIANRIYEEELEAYEYAENFMDNDFDRYLTNINIINHIRNAIAHGNFSMSKSVGEPVLERELIFDDIYEGRVTYSARIKVKTFAKLFSEETAKLVLAALGVDIPIVKVDIDKKLKHM